MNAYCGLGALNIAKLFGQQLTATQTAKQTAVEAKAQGVDPLLVVGIAAGAIVLIVGGVYLFKRTRK